MKRLSAWLANSRNCALSEEGSNNSGGIIAAWSRVLESVIDLTVAWFVHKLRKRLGLRNKRKRHDIQRPQRAVDKVDNWTSNGGHFFPVDGTFEPRSACNGSATIHTIDAIGQLITRQETVLQIAPPPGFGQDLQCSAIMFGSSIFCATRRSKIRTDTTFCNLMYPHQ